MKIWDILFFLSLSIAFASAQTCLSNDQCITAIWNNVTQHCDYEVLVGSPCDVGRSCYNSGICKEDATCSSTRILCEDFVPPCYYSAGCSEQLDECIYLPLAPGTSCDTGDFCEVNGQCDLVQECVGELRDCSKAYPCSVSVCGEQQQNCVFDYYVACDIETCEGLCTYGHESWASDLNGWENQTMRYDVICDNTYEYWITTPTLGNYWAKLFNEWLAYTLNINRGSCYLDDINNIANLTYDYLISNCYNMESFEYPLPPFLQTLRDYNTGVSGPGQCLEDLDVIQCQNGIQNCNLDSCDCYPGWTGEECDTCDTNPPEGYAYLCVPLPFDNLTSPDLDDDVIFVFRMVEVELYPLYLDGVLPSFGQPIFDDDEDPEPMVSYIPGTNGLDCGCNYVETKREINEQSDDSDLVGDDMCLEWQLQLIILQQYLDETEEHCCLPLLDIDDEGDDDDGEEHEHCHVFECEDGEDDDDDDDCDSWWIPFIVVLVLFVILLFVFIWYVFFYERPAYETIGAGMDTFYNNGKVGCPFCHKDDQPLPQQQQKRSAPFTQESAKRFYPSSNLQSRT